MMQNWLKNILPTSWMNSMVGAPSASLPVSESAPPVTPPQQIVPETTGQMLRDLVCGTDFRDSGQCWVDHVTGQNYEKMAQNIVDNPEAQRASGHAHDAHSGSEEPAEKDWLGTEEGRRMRQELQRGGGIS